MKYGLTWKESADQGSVSKFQNAIFFFLFLWAMIHECKEVYS